MSDPTSAPYYLVIDLEATCDDTGRVPRHEMETIEIGAVLVDGATLEPIDEFQTFVRPLRHPVLTPFCTRLTSIVQAQVADAPLFPEAMDALCRFRGDLPAVFCSWGSYDRKQLHQDCAYHQIPYPLGDHHLNLKQQFSARRNDPKKFGMAGALRAVGLELAGTHHRGIDDARNIARLLPFIVEKHT